MRLGIIRVLTTDDEKVLLEHGRLIEAQYGLRSFTRCIPDQPSGVFDEITEARAVPKIVALGREMEESGAGALFLSCASDPGLAELRAAVRVPVIGAGSAAARVAAMLGLPVAVIGVGAKAPRPFRALLDEKVRYARPSGVTTTNDLLTPVGAAAALDSARALHAEGIQVIAFACTGLSTIGLAATIREQIGCAVVDAVSAAGMFAVELLRAGAG